MKRKKASIQHDGASSSFLSLCHRAKSKFKQQLAARIASHRDQEFVLQAHPARPRVAHPPQHPNQQRTRLVADSFYGADHARALDAVEAVIRRYQKHRKTQYSEFPKQAAAIEWAAANSVRLWSAQRANGSRYFIAASFYTFWHQYYHETAPDARHHYEIIHENQPCKLYFDVEYDVQCNPHVDGAVMIDHLVEAVGCALQAHFSIPLRGCTIVELDSTTPSKFSRHVIIGLPGAAFANNRHVGAFVQALVRNAGNTLLVRKGPDTDIMVPCVDLGVYTRNRAFRIYLSSKAGKHVVLQTTGRFGWPPACTDAAHKDIFMASLVTNVDVAAHLLTSYNNAHTTAPNPYGGTHTHSHPTAAPDSYGGTPPNVSMGTHPPHLSMGIPHPSSTRGHPIMVPHTPPTQYGPSPLVSLDAYITTHVVTSHVCRGAAQTDQDQSDIQQQGCLTDAQRGCCRTQGSPHTQQGSIRSWVLFQEASVMLYNIKDYRWCGNIQRHHKSNGVYFVVDLQHGYMYQKCYDPECRAYRSPCRALPQHVCDDIGEWLVVHSTNQGDQGDKGPCQATSMAAGRSVNGVSGQGTSGLDSVAGGRGQGRAVQAGGTCTLACTMRGPGSAALFQVEGLDEDALLSLVDTVEGGAVVEDVQQENTAEC